MTDKGAEWPTPWRTALETMVRAELPYASFRWGEQGRTVTVSNQWRQDGGAMPAARIETIDLERERRQRRLPNLTETAYQLAPELVKRLVRQT